MLFGGHDEVVGLVLVIDNVLQGNAQLVVQAVEKVLKLRKKIFKFCKVKTFLKLNILKVVRCCSR